MARTLKKGLDFFHFDTSFFDDIKIRKLIRYHGAQAVVVYQLVLIRIYHEGYYLQWDDDLPFIVAEVSHLQDDYVKTVISYCIEIGLFDKTLFDSDHVLTSKGIQNRFFDFCVVAKRKIATENPYLLVDLSSKAIKTSSKFIPSEVKGINSEEIAINSEEIENSSEETGFNSEFGTQSKVKESKENIDSSLRSESSSSSPMTEEEKKIDIPAFIDFFNGKLRQYKSQIPKIVDIKGKRLQSLNARLKDYGKDALRTAVINAASAPILNGAGQKVFVASIDWILRPNNFPKVLEGNYNHSITNSNMNSYGAEHQSGYRTGEEIVSGAIRIISEIDDESQQPKEVLPVI